MHVLQACLADQVAVCDGQLAQLDARLEHGPKPIVRDTAARNLEAGQLVTIAVAHVAYGRQRKRGCDLDSNVNIRKLVLS